MSEKAKIVSVETCTAPPVLIQFQNAVPSNPEDFIVHFAGKGGKSSKAQPLLVTSSSPDTIYSGTVEQSALVDNYMVIRNKTTNKVRLVPYRSCTLINEYYTSLPLSIPTSEQDKLALRYSIAKYGGKNALKAQDRVNRMRVNIDVIKDQLDQTIAMSSQSMKLEHMEEERLMDIQDEGVEPPKNYEAKTVQELYDLRQILTQDLVEDLESTAKEMLESKPADLPISSEFLMDKFCAIQRSTTLSQSDQLLSVSAIILVDALQSLIQQSHGYQRKPLQRISMSELCEAVEMHIRRSFVDPNSVTGLMTKFTRRKAICHYLVLSIMLAPKMELSTEAVVADLKIRKEELLDFARFLNLRTALNNSFLGLRMPTNKKDDDSRKILRVKTKKKK